MCIRDSFKTVGCPNELFLAEADGAGRAELLGGADFGIVFGGECQVMERDLAVFPDVEHLGGFTHTDGVALSLIHI